MRILVLVAALGAGGCSWVFVRRAPDVVAPSPAAARAVQCTDAYNPPVVDTVLASTMFTLAQLEAFKLGDDENTGEEIGALAGNLAGFVVFAFSAAYGFKHVTDCRALHRSAGQVSATPQPSPALPSPATSQPGVWQTP